MIKLLLAFYLYFLSFVSAFSINTIFSIPLITSLIFSIVIIIYIVKSGEIISIDNKFLVSIYIFLLFITLTYSYQLFIIGYKSNGLNNWLSYFVVIFLYLISFYSLLDKIKINICKVYKYISWGVLFTSTFTILEFTIKNFTSIDFDSYIYRESINSYDAIYRVGGKEYIRARGGAEESGHLSMFLLMFAPICFYYYYTLGKKVKFVIYGLLIFLSWVLTFSANGWIALCFSGLILSTLIFFKNISYKKIYLYGLISTLIFITIFSLQKFGFFGSIISKLTFNNISSSQDRLKRWEDAINLFMDSPIIGWGPGISTIKYNTGFTNFYLEILTQGGLLLLFIYFTMFVIIIVKLLNIKSNIKLIYLFSLITGSINFFAISNYWYPWIWTLWALILYEEKISRVEN